MADPRPCEYCGTSIKGYPSADYEAPAFDTHHSNERCRIAMRSQIETLKLAIHDARKMALEEAAQKCEYFAGMLESGAGDVPKGRRLRQAARNIRAIADPVEEPSVKQQADELRAALPGIVQALHNASPDADPADVLLSMPRLGESKSTEHNWSGWPGAFCLNCGIDDPGEVCLAECSRATQCVDGHEMCTAHPPWVCTTHVNTPCKPGRRP